MITLGLEGKAPEKKHGPRIWLMIMATVLGFAIVVPTYSQLQQSGGGGSTTTLQSGSTTTVTQATGTNLHTVVDSGTTTVTQGTGTNLHTVLDSGTLTGITNALPTGTNVIGTVNTIPKTACGNTVASQTLIAVPTSSTAVFSSTTCIMAIVMNNTTSGALTVTVSDNIGTPINDLLTFSIPAFSQLIQPLWGISFTTGVKWVASGAGVTGAIIGYQ